MCGPTSPACRMAARDLRDLIERIPGMGHPCDLDLLIFFYRHPSVLLKAEQLVDYLGYDRELVAKSLDRLIEAGLVLRSQNPARTARLYVLELTALPGGLLASFLEIVATRAGRQEAIRLLRGGTDQRTPSSHRRRPRLSKVA
jgi:DNA-binding MarR family transcriptional regulator